MTMLPFHALFPEQARRESLGFALRSSDGRESPALLIVENYCVEKHCDCRRVLLGVIETESRQQVATISYAFEQPKGLLGDEGRLFLDPLNPQSEYSDTLLDGFEKMVAANPACHERFVRHYETWKQAVDDPGHPCQEVLRRILKDESASMPIRPLRRQGPKVGPNEPCPCGSGRKFKRCCRA